MKTTRRTLIAASLAAIAAVSVPVAVRGWSDGDEDEICFSRTEVFIELNSSAEDVGIQVMLDGEPWKIVTARDPRGRRILDILAKSSVRRQGLTELFFESSEPPFDEVSLAEFLARFPEGEYEFEGMTIDGQKIEGEAMFTHVIPAGPEITSPEQSEDDPPVVDPCDTVIEWEPVTETFFGSCDIEIVNYEVIVVQLDPHREFKVDLPPTQTSVTVPKEFLQLRGTRYEFEILAKEVSGNQTITEGEFVTAD